MGLLSVVAGIIVLALPGLTLVGLAVVLGIWLLVFGVMEIGMAFRVRMAPGLLSKLRPRSA
jgi:uncharacterized membrane protein HdeD (DUF308 family)